VRHSDLMRRVWYPACRSVGITATPHDSRASHATWLSEVGWSPVVIVGRLGHVRPTVTLEHYARRVSGRDVEIARGLDQCHGAVGQARGVRRARDVILRLRSALELTFRASDLR